MDDPPALEQLALTSGPGQLLDVEIVPVYQPIVDLRDERVVGVEALARGWADGHVMAAQALFAAAAATGEQAVRDLDERCLRAALTAGSRATEPDALFVNVEPGTLGDLTAECLAELAALVAVGVRVVVEVTERDLLDKPAQLLAGVRRARECGWWVALDDVGSEPAALALMPFLAPDVIKLDLALIRQQPSLLMATTINAVHAQAERSGALVLAEGIETDDHLERALAAGAQLGQGWRFGHPAGEVAHAQAELHLPRHVTRAPSTTPFGALSAVSTAGIASVPLLAVMARQLEQQALLLDDLTVVLANFQHVRSLGISTRRRYEAVARVAAFTALLGPGMPDEPASGVRGTSVDAGDPLAEEWVVAVVAPHFAGALAARELEPRHGEERRLAFVLTHDRTRVIEAASLLLERVRPAHASSPEEAGGPAAGLPSASSGVPPGELPDLLLRAIDTATNAISISDARAPDLPLVYANRAFLKLTGYGADNVVGRNCRFLQGPETDQAQVRPLARKLAAGHAVCVTLRNYRQDGTPFWNEITISPVHGQDGEVTHFIGNQVDVTDRVEREERATYLAYHDALTGLPNRVQLLDHLALELARARRSGRAVAVLFLDLDGFKSVNDTHGHTAGDAVLATVASRMRETLREGDILARYSGDEFVAVLSQLPHDDPAPAQRAAQQLASAVNQPVLLQTGRTVSINVTVGVSLHPGDGTTPHALIDAADRRMYHGKG